MINLDDIELNRTGSNNNCVREVTMESEVSQLFNGTGSDNDTGRSYRAVVRTLIDEFSPYKSGSTL